MSTTDPPPHTDGHQDVGNQNEAIPPPDLNPEHVDVSDLEQHLRGSDASS